MNEQLHVGRPNFGDRDRFLKRVSDALDRRWLSNDGPFLKEFEQRIAELLGVEYAIAVCNATAGLELAAKALGLRGEVIIPSYTFVATAHALQWLGITPVFADMDPATHNIDPGEIENLISPRTTGIVGVHVWGRSCDTLSIESIARDHGLKVMYDASHGFACSAGGRMIGSFGACEVFSFHATKFINCFEGGAVVTNDGELAEKLRIMRSFGFADYDKVACLGINAKMNEISAAMGITNLEAMEAIVAVNQRNYEAYKIGLEGIPGFKILEYDPEERNNYQYVVAEVDPDVCSRNRDEIVAALHAEDVLARKYFWPGCHRMEPYRTTHPDAWRRLPQTERIASRVIVFPTGQTVDEATISRVCALVGRTVRA